MRSKVKLSKKDFDWAAGQGLITPDQANALWSEFKPRSSHANAFDFTNLAYYSGAIIVILAMAWYLTISWERVGAAGILSISGLYSLMFALGARYLWFEKKLKVPGGLMCALAVCMTPLMVYAIERMTGLWPQGDPGTYQNFHIWIKGSWFMMELCTIAASVFALRFIRFPFLTAPIAYCLWYMSMDLTPLAFSKVEFDWHERLVISLLFGMAMLFVAYMIDLKRKDDRDFAFWIYLFGTIAFFSAVALFDKGNELYELLCALIYLGMIIISVLVQRRVLMIFGAIGMIGYLSHLAWTVFKDSTLFPIALSLLGMAIIGLGIFLQQNREAIEERIWSTVPQNWQAFLPERNN